MGAFKEPHGGELKNLYLDAHAAEAEKQAAGDYASWDLTERQLCDIELILNGAFSPLDGFLNKDDYDAVVSGMRLASGVLWPMPITLDVTEEFAADLKSGDKVALRDLEGVILATLEVGDIWTPDKAVEAQGVFGTTDEKHPAVHYLNNIAQPGLRRRQAHGRRSADSLRFQAPARQPGGTARPLQEARLAQGRGVPDAQPDAPGAPGD